MTTGKPKTLTKQTFVGKVMSLLFNNDHNSSSSNQLTSPVIALQSFLILGFSMARTF